MTVIQITLGTVNRTYRIPTNSEPTLYKRMWLKKPKGFVANIKVVFHNKTACCLEKEKKKKKQPKNYIIPYDAVRWNIKEISAKSKD